MIIAPNKSTGYMFTSSLKVMMLSAVAMMKTATEYAIGTASANQNQASDVFKA